MKTYELSITVSHIEAVNEADAINEFEQMVSDGVFGADSYEVELQPDEEICPKHNAPVLPDQDGMCSLCGEHEA